MKRHLTLLLLLVQWTAPILAQSQLGSPPVPSGIQIRSVLPQEVAPDPPDPPDPPAEQTDPEDAFTGNVITVCASGCDETGLQDAIDDAACEDIIRAEAGETFTGNFELPDKNSGMECQILITTSETTGDLPPNGDRVCPNEFVGLCTPNTDPDLFPTIRGTQTSGSQNAPAILVEAGANGWMLRRLRLTNGFNGSGSSIRVGQNSATDQPTRADQPTNITVDQVYFDFKTEHPYLGQRRAIELHGKAVTLKNSHIWGVNAVGNDAMGIWVCNAEGPVTIQNNFIQGGAYTFITCGDTPHIKTVATVTGNATTTGASVSWASGNTPNGDPPFVGQTIAPSAGGTASSVLTGTRYHSVVTAVANVTATSADVTWAPAIAEAPDGDIRWGIMPGDCSVMPSPCLDSVGLLFQYNDMSRDPTLRGGTALPAPTGLTASDAGGGSLAAGSYGVQVLGRLTSQGQTVSGATASTTVAVSASGAIAWSVDDIHADVTTYRLVVTHPDGSVRFEDFATNSGTYDSNGTVGTVPTASVWQMKNLFELKGCINCLIRYNYIHDSWSSPAGSGICIWNKSTNNVESFNGSSPWAENTNVTYEYNVITRCPGVLSHAGNEYESNLPYNKLRGARGLKFRNNLAFNISNVLYGTSGTDAIFLTNGCTGCEISNNTIDYTGNTFTIEIDGSVSKQLFLDGGFTLRDNLFTRRNSSGGLRASGFAEGEASIASETRGVGPGGTYTVTGNVWGNAVSGPSATTQPYPNHNVTSPVGNVFISDTAWRGLFVSTVAATELGYLLVTPSDYATAAASGGAIGVSSILLLATEVGKAKTGVIGAQPDDEVPETPPGPTTTTFYIARSAPDISPAFAAGWNVKSSVDRWTAAPLPTGTLSGEATGAAMTATNPEHQLLIQAVGPALAAQTITGTVKCVFNTQENNNALDATLAIGIRIVSADGSTVRGTLLDITSSDSATSLYEFHGSSSFYRPRGCYTSAESSDLTLTEVEAESGDRLVFEIGCTDHSTSTSARCDILAGDDALTDLLQVDDMDYDPDTSGQTGNPSIVFSEEIELLAP